MAAPIRILHAHSTFSLGGKEARAVRLMNAFGTAAEHSVVSAMPEQLSARDAIDPDVSVRFPADAPSLTGSPTPARLFHLARYLRGFDLVLSYNWGAFDVVMARRLFGGAMRSPPLVHHEDGFNEDEALRRNPARNLYRRIGLSTAARLVVPSARLAAIAREEWRQPPEHVALIGNGIPVSSFAQPAAAHAIPGFVRREGEIVVGSVAGLRAVKNLPRLVRCFAAMEDREARLVVVGEGPERQSIEAEAARLGVADRVHLPGFLASPQAWLGLFDIFALSSDSEQSPISLMEAMAAGLPAVATAVGDVPTMVSADNRPLIVEPHDEPAFTAALDTLAARSDLRSGIGLANREKAIADYGEDRMIASYAALYGKTIGAPLALMST
jgi:glycosyltransferase involved in cell wall biosynthesis